MLDVMRLLGMALHNGVMSGINIVVISPLKLAGWLMGGWVGGVGWVDEAEYHHKSTFTFVRQSNSGLLCPPLL